MGLQGCGGAECACGISSSSLTIARSGDTFTINALAFMNVTSLTRPASPALNQHIYETDTGRFRIWNGTYWVITGGNMPGFQIERQTLQSIPNNAETTVTLPTEIYDTDAFHTGSDGFITIPVGLGGDYLLPGHGQWAASVAGTRYMRPLVAANATVMNGGSRTGGYSMVGSTVQNGFPLAELFRLEAGATVTLRAFQDSGAALDLNAASLKGIMVRHLPNLT